MSPSWGLTKGGSRMELTMSARERNRLDVMKRVEREELTLGKAAELMKVSYRQAKRIWRRWSQSGDAGLVHGLRGKAGNRRMDGKRREAILVAYLDRYEGFGPTLACEKLEEQGVAVDHETLRRWLVQAGHWSKQRRREAHRRRRERKARRGELVQMDGSEHDWFEGRGERCVLMVMIDDATGRVYAQFHRAETTEAAMATFAGYVGIYGLPRALYVDRDSIYQVNRPARVEENLAHSGALTQFGRAMKELGVEIKRAHSPQAKGRVERMNGTLQDRLVKEMRLGGIRDIASANAFLAKFLPKLNARFGVEAREAADLHRSLSWALGRGQRLEDILCRREPRQVQNDWCVLYEGRVFQIEQKGVVRPKQSVTVRQKLDGRIELVYRGQELACRELPARPAPARVRVSLQERVAPSSGAAHKPSADHPWRRGPARLRAGGEPA
jgi:transposase-like protein